MEGARQGRAQHLSPGGRDCHWVEAVGRERELAEKDSFCPRTCRRAPGLRGAGPRAVLVRGWD